ncbi:hypothetical protein AK812_SmicGene40352, partial [Symbiodinium microadriaticum]
AEAALQLLLGCRALEALLEKTGCVAAISKLFPYCVFEVQNDPIVLPDAVQSSLCDYTFVFVLFQEVQSVNMDLLMNAARISVGQMGMPSTWHS